jgi:hypothetical protein
MWLAVRKCTTLVSMGLRVGWNAPSIHQDERCYPAPAQR